VGCSELPLNKVHSFLILPMQTNEVVIVVPMDTSEFDIVGTTVISAKKDRVKKVT